MSGFTLCLLAALPFLQLFAVEFRFRVEEMGASGHIYKSMPDTRPSATPAETVLGQVSPEKLLGEVGNIWELEMSVLHCSFKSSVRVNSVHPLHPGLPGRSGFLRESVLSLALREET